MEFRMIDNAFELDAPFGRLQISGDDQYGFRPFQLLVSSVAVCSGGVLRKVLTKMRVPFDDITIKAEVERVKEEADRVSKIHLHFILTGTELSEEKVKKALDVTYKNCSMVQSVKDSIEIHETFEIRR
ncbi:OsmC family protein [Brevibacillus dissolubilis]|uniref:OsmC family protein n=1 Tax=Brevibacillus dissolubilis TaxID=1844116 RepID=UPI0011160A37|nr:OsmC family protein [Brevibacillus dissolubilis]